MASTYVETLLLDALYKASQSDGFQKFEERPSKYGFLDAAFGFRELLLPSTQIEAMRVASSRATKVDVFKKEAAGNGTVRKCAGTGSGATARVPITWQTIVEEMSITELEMAENTYTLQEMFNRRLNQKIINLFKRMELAGIAVLESNISVGEGNNFPVFNDTFQVAESKWNIAANQAALWLNDVRADFEKNDLDGDMIHMVGDAQLKAIFASLIAQGSGNAVNTFFQMPGMSSSYTNRITNNTGIKSTAYAFEKGAFGILTWINKLEREGRDIGTDRWYSFSAPRYGFQIGVKYQGACADNSANVTGAQADLVHKWVLAVDVAFPVQYSSDDNTGIYKYELDTDDNTLSGSGSIYS